MGAAPRGAVGPADHEAVAAEQRADRTAGRRQRYARSRGYRYRHLRSHAHLPLASEVDGVHYFNSGTWIEPPPCPFVAVKGAEVRLQWWPLPGFEQPLPEAASEAEAVPASTLPAFG